MIRIEAGMPTTRFCSLIGVPERTWRRHQARARADRPTRGPWPRPARERVRDAARRHALAHPAWGHRRVWAMCRHDGHRISQATVLRLLRDEGLLLQATYQRERRALAARRKAGVRHRADRPEPGLAAGLLASSRPPPAARGGWPAAGTTGARTSWAGTWHPQPTPTT